MRDCRRHRLGFTVPELLVACVVLATLTTVSVRMLRALAEQRSAVDARACALWEAANQLERISIESWHDLTEEHLADYALSDDAAWRLPDGQLKIRVADEGQSPAAKRVVVEIRWRGPAGEFVAPARLTSWFPRTDTD